MRILFYSGGTKGSGHIVLGLSVTAALRRSGLAHEYAMVCAETPFTDLARKTGVEISTVPNEAALMLSDRWKDSVLFAYIGAYAPDILVVDQFWLALDPFIAELPCRKVILLHQTAPAFFLFPAGARRFRPEDYDLILKTEPNFDLPFQSRQIEPIVIRNRDEILSREAAIADLALSEEGQNCLFAFNGHSWEGEEAWKNFSYLEQEGWNVVRSDNRRGGLFPAVDWYNAFDLLVCGAGYSAFWEARWFGKEAFFVPFPRHFEDQGRRIAFCSDFEMKRNGADELVRMLQGL